MGRRGGGGGPDIALCSPAAMGALLCCWLKSDVGEGHQGSILLNVELVQRQLVHEGTHQVVRSKIENQAEENGDGQSGERLLEDGEEEEGQTQALRRRIPRCCLGFCGGTRTTNTWSLTMRMATKQASVVFQSPLAAAEAFPTSML